MTDEEIKGEIEERLKTGDLIFSICSLALSFFLALLIFLNKNLRSLTYDFLKFVFVSEIIQSIGNIVEYSETKLASTFLIPASDMFTMTLFSFFIYCSCEQLIKSNKEIKSKKNLFILICVGISLLYGGIFVTIFATKEEDAQNFYFYGDKNDLNYLRFIHIGILFLMSGFICYKTYILIKFLKEKSTIADTKKIFPNQLGNFQNLENLQYDESIPEILKDIHNDLESTTRNKFEIREKLLLKEITCYKTYNRLTQKEIIGKIEKKFQNLQDRDTRNPNEAKEAKEKKTKISEKILSLLPNNNTPLYEAVSTAISEFIPDYNNIFNKNIVPQRAKITTELNYGIFLRYIILETLSFIEKIPKEQIPSKIESISKIIKFTWEYQDNEFINLSVDPSKYKIFVNQNNEFEKIEKLRFEEEFGQAQNPIIDKLFNLAKLYPIESDFKNVFLSQIFTNNLKDYKNKFRPMTLNEICRSIEYKLIEFYEKNVNNNFLDKKYESFRKVFFQLNEILKTATNSSNLKKNFPRFMRLRGAIALKFLDVYDEMDNFIDDIMRVVEFKTAE